MIGRPWTSTITKTSVHADYVQNVYTGEHLNILLSVGFQGIMYGIFICLVMLSSYSLIYRNANIKARAILLVVSLVMFGASTAYLANSIVSALYPVHWGSGGYSYHTLWRSWYAQWALPAINYVGSDAIVIWRGWVLWGYQSRKVFIFPIALLFGSVVAAVLEAVTTIKLSDALSGATGGCGLIKCYATALNAMLASWILSLSTNVVATGLIAYKAWKLYFLHRMGNVGSSKTRTQKVVLLLVESGALYVLCWILVLATNGRNFSSPDLNQNEGANESSYQVGMIIQDIFVYISGMYPVVIIVLVTLQGTVCDNMTDNFAMSSLRVADAAIPPTGQSFWTSSDASSSGPDVSDSSVLESNIRLSKELNNTDIILSPKCKDKEQSCYNISREEQLGETETPVSA